MRSSGFHSRTLSRDIGIVWAGVLLAIIGWVGSEYGYEVQGTAQGTIAVAGNLLVIVGLITVTAGFASVVRAARRTAEGDLPDPPPESAIANTGHSR